MALCVDLIHFRSNSFAIRSLIVKRCVKCGAWNFFRRFYRSVAHIFHEILISFCCCCCFYGGCGWNSLSNDDVRYGDAFDGVGHDKTDISDGRNALFAVCPWKMVKQNYVRKILRCVNERKQTWLIWCDDIYTYLEAMSTNSANSDWPLQLLLFHFILLRQLRVRTASHSLGHLVERFFIYLCFTFFHRHFWSASFEPNEWSKKIQFGKAAIRATERKLNVVKDIDRFHGSWSDARNECAVCDWIENHFILMRMCTPWSVLAACPYPMNDDQDQIPYPIWIILLEIGKKNEGRNEKDLRTDFAFAKLLDLLEMTAKMEKKIKTLFRCAVSFIVGVCRPGGG